MIFLAIHTHPADRCISDDPEMIKRFREALSSEVAERRGCRLIGVYVAPLEHIAYIIFEADEHDSLLRFLRPLMKLGETKITPVAEWMDVSSRL